MLIFWLSPDRFQLKFSALYEAFPSKVSLLPLLWNPPAKSFSTHSVKSDISELDALQSLVRLKVIALSSSK